MHKVFWIIISAFIYMQTAVFVQNVLSQVAAVKYVQVYI